MEAAELVVVVRSQGLERVNAALAKLGKLAETSAGKIDLNDVAVQHLLVELQKYEKLIGTIERAYKRQNKAIDENRAAVKKAEADKIKAMDRTQSEAIKMDKKITASRKKMWTEAEKDFKKAERDRMASDKRVVDNAIREGKREQAAKERLQSHPFSAGIARAFGQVKGVSFADQAKSADLFRGKTFDFLLMFGTAKAAKAIIMSYLVEPMEKLIGTAIDFERQWLLVTQTVTGSASQMAQVQKEFLGLIAARPFKPEEITAAARALGELGVATNEIIQGTDYITRFSIASGIATDEAANLIGQILATGGAARPTAQQIGELASAALDMGTNFAIGNKGVLTTMLRVSALIPTFHLSKAGALGLSTAMGSLGIKAERGATGLQLMLSVARSAEGTQLDRFANIVGRTAEETKNLIKTDPSEFIAEFLKGFNEMADSGYDVNKMLSDLGIKTSRARQMVGQLAGGIDTVDEALQTANDTLGKTNELMRQSDLQLQGTGAMMGTLGNSVWALGVSLTKDLLPFLKSTIQELTVIANGFTWAADKANDFYDATNPFRVYAREQQRNAEALKALEGKGPLIGAGRPDYTDPNINPVTGKPYKQEQTIPLITNKAAQDEALKRQGEQNKLEAKYRKKLESEAASFDAQARTPKQQEEFRLGQLNEMITRGIIDKARYDVLAADAAKTRAEAEEREAKSASKLTAGQRDANKVVKESLDPYQKFDALLVRIAEARKHGVSEQLLEQRLQKGYKTLLKDINTEAGTSEAKIKAQTAAQKKLNDEMDKYANTLNPIADLEAEIAKIRAAHAARPGVVTDEIMREAIAKANRDVKLPEEYEKTMRIVQGITERGMNAVADTMTDALFDGATKGRDIMKAFAKDITNILLEEMLFKPVAGKIVDTFKDMQIADFSTKIKSGMPGGGGSGTEMSKAADSTTASFETLGKGALNLLLDLSSGIGAFLSGLLLGQGGEGFTAGGFFKALGIGAAEGAISYYGKGLIPKGTVPPDTSHEVPFSSQDGQSSYDPSGGAFGYDTGFSGSRASLMATSGSAMHTGTHGMAPPVNITVTALDPRTASSVIMSNMPVIERGMQRAVDRGAAYAKAHGRRR